MKRAIGILMLSLISIMVSGQVSMNYSELIERADSLLSKKEYQEASRTYSKAFQMKGGKGPVAHRYRAARSWAMSGERDSAFFNLQRIVTAGKFSDINLIKNDSDLNSLHDTKEWAFLIEAIMDNREKYESHINGNFVKYLDTIFLDDQKFRLILEKTLLKFPLKSQETKQVLSKMEKIDSINTIKITTFIDRYGWLGRSYIGEKGCNTLFLVIQHSKSNIQEKYLPQLEIAVKMGDVPAEHLALLTDRVLVGRGKKQRYGSQLQQDMITNKMCILPIEDPDNIDKIRKSVGLVPLAEYLRQWDIIWDVEEYKTKMKQ